MPTKRSLTIAGALALGVLCVFLWGSGADSSLTPAARKAAGPADEPPALSGGLDRTLDPVSPPVSQEVGDPGRWVEVLFPGDRGAPGAEVLTVAEVQGRAMDVQRCPERGASPVGRADMSGRLHIKPPNAPLAVIARLGR